MRKKGQVTMFIIAGIVIVAAVLLVIFLRGRLFVVVTPENLPDQLISIQDHIENCLKEVAPDYIERIGLQGGYLSTPEETFRSTLGIPISYLCYNQDRVPNCYNRMLTLPHMQDELSRAIQEGLQTCLDLRRLERGFSMDIGALDVDTEIGKDNVLVTANLPITLTKEQATVSEDEFFVNFDYPLGRLYDVSQEIIDIEAVYGEFDQLNYMLAKRGQYIIEKQRPYPDKLYILQHKDSNYIFQFHVQGEPL
ncbi:MAG: hypothetical protein Q8R00_04850 [Candidatus Nanoarchaeia archaeon]|nr:hypothetical protein [Candidatus Nanoarchaeia archaeon]